MESVALSKFCDHLVEKRWLKSGPSILGLIRAHSSERALRAVWKASDASASDFADEVAAFFDRPRVALSELLTSPPLTGRFSSRFMREMLVFPYQTDQGACALAIGDPTDSATIRAAEIVLGSNVTLCIASFEEIALALEQRIDQDGLSAEQSSNQTAASDDDIDGLRDLASGAPVVRAVNDLFEKAVELRASDIHIEPFRSGLIIRMRVDGLLRAIPAPAGVLPRAVISRIKILAGLNIAERRLPQDGAARLNVTGSELDIRVAIMPTQYGEAAVVRLLPKDRGLLAIEKLGFLALDEKKIRGALQLPHGMIIITGPTGSGKTTTLATFLTLLNEPTRKILTVEDPVEYEIPGINQSQVKPSIGLTFASALRSFVRQDPDVIMVGEIRDAETAHIAVHAALTGHLVLTTLHTESAAAAVPRLLDLGVEAFLLRSTLRVIIAQRLVRQLCERCKVLHEIKSSDLSDDPRRLELGFKPGDRWFEPAGCDRCNGTGYRGRVGIFEVLEVGEKIRPLVATGADAATIEGAASRAGMTGMADDGLAKCRSGLTSITELLRVISIR